MTETHTQNAGFKSFSTVEPTALQSVKQPKDEIRKTIAQELAKKQKEISVAEFFEKNKHILGFDNPTRAVLTTVKEAVDNALDACEEANVLPDIIVEIQKVDKDEYRVCVEDNGPGIVKKQIPFIFGRMLYGSRFYAIRQSRGQQGIGISAAVMYGQLSTGKPTLIKSKTPDSDVATITELIINTRRNMPEVLREDVEIWYEKVYDSAAFEKETVANVPKAHGVRVEIQIRGKYQRGKQSPYEYLRQTAIVNPHAKITLIEPDGTKTIFNRVTEIPPKPTVEIKPHPYGTELGTLLNLAKTTKSRRISAFLVSEFSRITYRVAHEICQKAGVSEELEPNNLDPETAKKLIEAFNSTKIMAPETSCLSPIGEKLIRKGLKNVLGSIKADYYVPPVTREPKVYSGNPFQVEVGMIYGGEMPKDLPVQILRFANRVPLMFQQGACAITLAVQNVDWRRYGLEQHGGTGIPTGPATILVHVASTKIPFTSEAKEAIADIPEIRNEIELALKELARKLHIHLNKEVRRTKIREKFDIVQKVLPRIAEKSAQILHRKVPALEPVITKIMDVVWIDDNVVYENGLHNVTVSVYNYTPRTKCFNLYVVLPQNVLITNSVIPKPRDIRDGYKVEWELKNLRPCQKIDVKFELRGLAQGEYDECELYISGIDPVHVVGAQALPGDWDLEGLPEVSEAEELPEMIDEDKASVAETENNEAAGKEAVQDE